MAERTVAKIHPHRVVLLGYYVLAALILCASLAIFFYPELLYFYEPFYVWSNSRLFSLSVGAIGLAVLFWAEIDINNHQYVVTKTRVVKRKGLFTVWERDLLFDEISRSSIKRSVFDRMFGDVGTVVVELRDGGENDLFEHVEDAEKIKNMVDRLTGRIK